MIIEVTAEERDVIRNALRVSIEESRVRYHRAAAGASVERALQLSTEYEGLKEGLCALLRKVGDATMESSKAPNDHEEGHGNE